MLPLIDFVIVGHHLLRCLVGTSIAIAAGVAVAVAIAIVTSIAVAVAVATAVDVATALIRGRGRGRCGIVWHILIGIWYLIVRVDVQRRDNAGNRLRGHFAQFFRLERVL